MTAAPDLITLACDVIRAIEAAEPRMRAVGDAMEAAYPGLRCDVPIVIPGDVATAIDALLDAALGDGWASWYLYDTPSLRARGGVRVTTPDGTEWTIRTVDDLERLARYTTTVDGLDALTAAAVALARHNVPPDWQEALVHGTPGARHPIRPGALRAAIRAAMATATSQHEEIAP